ncbi:hypothetical protein [Ruminiclostridium papyrosolvens]|uniref:Uncharacterized protein n=1 Tax=Ruminiclostridium papyrosolvens C7 TaxID=1330534 RepID=U4QWH0_9FIRM|nr:hypothetical protein [Ruminiclostridium papyrosolvens]EPR07491.1 hypothetical protein L323_20345 [Ruminiclostridium papyrosolvens C7]
MVWESLNVAQHMEIKKAFNREEFNQINIGKSTGDDVKNIDPYCVIANGSKKDAISEHKFS